MAVKLSERILKVAQHRGAPQQMELMKEGDFERFLTEVKYDRTKMTASVKDQLASIAASCGDPNKGNPVFIISSELSALKAQQLALEIFYNAIDDYNHKEAPQKDLPLWHTVFGGFSDKLRDNSAFSKNPSMLVIDGLVTNATDIKVEKARDLLMKFSDIPRVIITCGTCPLQFAYERLYYSVNRVAFFGAKKHTTI